MVVSRHSCGAGSGLSDPLKPTTVPAEFAKQPGGFANMKSLKGHATCFVFLLMYLEIVPPACKSQEIHKSVKRV